ncbi:hypothetical protein SPF06_02585 [Sinomonas sp. JGH33]|uniref:ESX secretion-associated protein EspG n=1 Tax=Sinomonas terricola TaxID=3110330 RepID=A0ABU5T259_9MICC|nr:hypothetical protein [Sinomonas sp. JGH33]MEA5453599.1 hypothetical protein [Sinomonas sp. JGH33]
MTQSQITWTERDVRAAASVLDAATDEGHVLPTLTDEEVLALDGPSREQLVELPWVASQEVGKDMAAAVALRGLLAKGIAYPVHAEGSLDPVGLEASVDITGALVLRRTAARLVRFERQVSTGSAWLYAYVHDGGILTEAVDESGLHEFRAVTPGGIGGLVAGFVDPQSVASTDGAPESLDRSEFEAVALERLGEVLAVTVATAVSADGAERSFTVYVSRSTVTLLVPEEREGQTRVALQPVSGQTLQGTLAALVNSAA